MSDGVMAGRIRWADYAKNTIGWPQGQTTCRWIMVWLFQQAGKVVRHIAVGHLDRKIIRKRQAQRHAEDGDRDGEIIGVGAVMGGLDRSKISGLGGCSRDSPGRGIIIETCRQSSGGK